ncbi:diguanylate cyclase domain protein [Catonella morbi ATCC 51271]|uniref:Diguanylate cyclase domain protein n=1 Tax=Catonella morbi ATCC 51271 TaxID=592026 RepID=V2YAL9_9FIRM|nr:GGDEF domain-containing protein [Catonella morbi]ESL04701.1 diguanylate cyclase domain protein [Catonella morbi ATCC 51271]
MATNVSESTMDSDITSKLNQLDIISLKDGLTGLWNKKYLSDKVDDYVGGERNSGVLFIIDIDEFSQINERYGHIMGDACLVKLAGVLSNSFRDRDVASRISADEFGVFLVGNLTYKDIKSISSKLLKTAKEGFAGMKLDRDFTISIGIAKSPANGSDFLSLYRKAVEALSSSKQNGKNSFTIADEDYSKNKVVNTSADMEIVKHLISEKNRPNGAYKVEYDGFKHIYQFVSRYSARKETDIEIILFTISKKDGNMIEPITLSEAMFDLENIIKVSLRIGDVATKYSSCQYLVMLIGAHNVNPEDVVKRIVKNYSDFADKYSIVLKYDIDYSVLQEEK